MLENLVFAILAMGFLYMAIRPNKKDENRLIYIISIIYKLGFIVCLLFAVIDSYNISNYVTTYQYVQNTTYNLPLLASSNAIVVYSNTNLSLSYLNQYVFFVFAIVLFLGIILEIVEQTFDYGMEAAQLKSLRKGKE